VIRVHRCRGLTVAEVPGLTVAEVPGLTVAEVPGLTGAQVPGLTGAQIREVPVAEAGRGWWWWRRPGADGCGGGDVHARSSVRPN
jgi:hypothetical protein